MNTLELARMEDAAACYGIIEDGRAFQQEQGFVQWTKSYPDLDAIRQDIRAGDGYLIRVDGENAGYVSVGFDGEPAYASIAGQWHTEEPYAVIHRMAFARRFQGTGLSGTAFALIDALCRSKGVRNIRINTAPPNLRMQHVLEKNGFARCGVIVFQGGEKIAYDKTLP